MHVAIDISEEQAKRLKTEADRLGLTPEQFTKAAVVDLLDRKDDFSRAASYVLDKNADLYARLS